MSKEFDPSEVPVRPAATVVLLRDGVDGLETLLLRRNSKLQFAGGVWVFPGGSFESTDFEKAGTQNGHVVAPYAAARETEEETSLHLDPAEFVFYSHWTTPIGMPKRYATWFFVTGINGSDDVKVDGSEIQEHIWASPAEGLRRHREKDIEMMPPTFVTLTELAEYKTVDEALAACRARDAIVYEPRFSRADDAVVALYDGDAGYTESKADAEGPRHRCVMADSGWTYVRSS